jgi:hypothetical protein
MVLLLFIRRPQAAWVGLARTVILAWFYSSVVSDVVHIYIQSIQAVVFFVRAHLVALSKQGGTTHWWYHALPDSRPSCLTHCLTRDPPC